MTSTISSSRAVPDPDSVDAPVTGSPATPRSGRRRGGRSGRSGRAGRATASVTGTVGPLGYGVVTLWLSVIVLLPLAALTVKSFDDGLSGWWDAVTAPTALAALRVTILISIVVALVNAVMGTMIAWVLVRDEFPGKRWANAIIDLPFALPTIVASIVLLSLYGPESPVRVHLNATQPGVMVALAFVTLPFVVRSVQPVLIDVDQDVEQAAASLGASNRTIFRQVVLPALLPAVCSGAGLAFARAIGEYGSVVLIGGDIPRHTQVASQYIQQQIEVDSPINAAAVSVALLMIAFLALFVLRVLAGRGRRRQERAV